VRWEEERYVKLYTRDTADWLALPWQAQGLFALILRKVDKAGILALGKHGRRGLAAHLGGASAWPEIEPHLDTLIADGCVTIRDGALVIPNFTAAQEAAQSTAARKRAQRERDHTESQNVTDSHAPSRAVTPSHSIPSDPIPSDPRDLELSHSAGVCEAIPEAARGEALREPPAPSPPAEVRGRPVAAVPQPDRHVELDAGERSPEASTLLAELRRHPVIVSVAEAAPLGAEAALEGLAAALEGRRMTSAKPVAHVVQAIDDAARELATDAAGNGLPLWRTAAEKIGRYADRARAPRQDLQVAPVAEVPRTIRAAPPPPLPVAGPALPPPPDFKPRPKPQARAAGGAS
jgi:hypothetical protein